MGASVMEDSKQQPEQEWARFPFHVQLLPTLLPPDGAKEETRH
jgi:hypothetical protein